MKLDVLLIKMLSKKADKDVTTKAGAEFLRNDIETKTGEALSLNTIKRLVGILNYESSPRDITLDIIARYLGYRNYSQLLLILQDKISDFNTPSEFIDLHNLAAGTELSIDWAPDRVLRIKHLEGGNYLVVESVNSKLKKGDILSLSQIAKGFPFMVKEVIRAGESWGNYTAAQVEGISSIEVING